MVSMSSWVRVPRGMRWVESMSVVSASSQSVVGGWVDVTGGRMGVVVVVGDGWWWMVVVEC